jgi:hypothetical protein
VRRTNPLTKGTPMSTPDASPAKSLAASAEKQPDSIFLISFPKIVFLWPSFVAALVAGIYMMFAGQVEPKAAEGVPVLEEINEGEEGASEGPAFRRVRAEEASLPGQAVVGWLFLVVLSINLVVLSFDFPRATSLIIFFCIVAIGLGIWLVAVKLPTVLPILGDIVASIQPMANATFYWFFVTVLGIIYLGVWINTRFDYWEVRPNELLHHHGFLSDLERVSAPHLRIEKEINDIFEYMLLGSGRLILTPSNERRSIVLDNVLWISKKEKSITRMLGALQVQVRSEP